MDKYETKQKAILIIGLLLMFSIFAISFFDIGHGELNVDGLFIGFEEGASEQEVISILENYDVGMDYRLDYNIDHVIDRYYIVVDKDERLAVKYEFGKAENWAESGNDLKKGDYYIIHVWEPVVGDEDFLGILSEQDLQLKKFVWCHVRFDDGSRDWISGKDAIRIKKELELNEKVLVVKFESNGNILFVDFDSIGG